MCINFSDYVQNKISKRKEGASLCQRKIIKTTRITTTKKITKTIKTEITITKIIITTVDNKNEDIAINFFAMSSFLLFF